MFDNRIRGIAPFTTTFGYGVSSANERKAIRDQKIEESLMPPVAAPGAEQLRELSFFYNKILASIYQLRYPFTFPAIDKNGSSSDKAAISKGSISSSNQPNVKCFTGQERREKVDEIKSYVQGEIDRLMEKDGTEDDLDGRPGHVEVEYVEGDGYTGKLEYDPKTRKAMHMESQIDGGRTWMYRYDRGNDSTPETYYREIISPLTPDKEGEEANSNIYDHLRQTIYKNRDGTETLQEEKSIEQAEESR